MRWSRCDWNNIPRYPWYPYFSSSPPPRQHCTFLPVSLWHWMRRGGGEGIVANCPPVLTLLPDTSSKVVTWMLGVHYICRWFKIPCVFLQYLMLEYGIVLWSENHFMQMKRRSTQDKITANQQQQQQQQQAPASQGQLGSKVANALAKAEARRQKRLARQGEVLRTICCPFVKLQIRGSGRAKTEDCGIRSLSS